jgi:peptidoglycan/xylan/chitin deacetylase (PgdA/CDA1 family)
MLEPDRFEYSPIIDRPVIKWPNNARVALWVAPNIEFYEYLPPQARGRDPWPRVGAHPDVRGYAQRDYGNRVGFWRYLEVMDKHEIRCTVSLNMAILQHFPEIRKAMVDRNWDYMSHGIYNTRYLTSMPAEEEREFYKDTARTLKQYTGKTLKGMLGPSISSTVNTPDLMAEAGLLDYTDWLHDDQPFPLKVKRGKLISVPYSIELNDLVGINAQGHDSAYFCQIIKDQFDTLYQQGAKNGRVMCIALHPYFIAQPSRIKHLDEALGYILSHEGVWKTTADDITDYYMAHCYDDVVAHLAAKKKATAGSDASKPPARRRTTPARARRPT